MAQEIKRTILFLLFFVSLGQPSDKDSSSGNMAEKIKRAIRLGRPSDFKITSNVISQHEKLKKEVIDILKELSEKSEGLVIEKIKEEMWSTGGKIAGRGMVIGSGLTSIFLVSTPIAAPAAIGGMVIGYAVVAGSIWYEMRCSEEHAQKLKNIQTQLEAELNRYTESQEKVFRELDMYDVFQAGKDFEENLDVIKSFVRKAEKQAREKFSNIKAFFSKLENFYNNLDEDMKDKLNSKNFLMTVASLLSVGEANTYSFADMTTGALGIMGDAIHGDIPWWDNVHGDIPWWDNIHGDIPWWDNVHGDIPWWDNIHGDIPWWDNIHGDIPWGDAIHGEFVSGSPRWDTIHADIVSGSTWWNAIHGLNIIINSYLGIMDIAKFYELNKMRQEWNQGGQARVDLLKRENAKFDKEIKMKDFIMKIRDTILEHGY